MAITLSKPNQFKNSFTVGKGSDIVNKTHVSHHTKRRPMLPHYLWKIKVQICNKLRTRSTFSPSVMISVSISKLGLTDLIFVDPGVKVNSGYYRDVLLSQQLLPVMCDLSAISSPCNKTAHLHTGHATRCNFLSSQHPLSFLQICGRRIASTSARSIARYGVTSSNKCISRQSQLHIINELKKCLLDVWHDVMDQGVIDDAIDEWCKRLGVCVCGQKADITRNCRKLDNSNVRRTVWRDMFRFIKHDVCNLSQIWTLIFHR